jgi:putative aldouronate transport system substrate-binding protein
MNQVKKALSLLLFLCMTVALVACGSSAPPETGAPAAQTAAPAAEPAADEPAAEPAQEPESGRPEDHVDLVFYLPGDPPVAEVEVEAAINEKLDAELNAAVDFQFTTWTDFQQKYSNELTSGNSDLIYIANWFSYGTLAKAGAFLELDDLLDTYAPALRERAGEDNLTMCRVDGELYAIPALWPEYVPNGISFREDLRAKYDLPRPDSLENMELYFAGVKANEPDQPILRVTTEESTGLARAFDAAAALLIKYPWVGELPYGLAADITTPSQIYDYWNSQDFIDDCNLLKSWSDQGFWSKSALSDTNDPDSYKNGLNIAIVAGQNPNKHVTNMNDFAADHPDWATDYITYGEVTGAMYPGHATQNGTSIVRGTANPERAMMVINYMMMDEEMNRLVQAGIEGTHYELVDGIYKNLSTDFPYEGFNTWDLRMNEFKLVQETDVVLKELFAKYEVIGAKNPYPNVNIAGGFTEDFESYNAERTAVQNVMLQYLAPIQAGLVPDVAAAVEEFLTKVNDAGLEKCREGYKAQWAAYCEEYGYK